MLTSYMVSELFVNFTSKLTGYEAVAKDHCVESCDCGRIIPAEFQKIDRSEILRRKENGGSSLLELTTALQASP